jgi:hypothetical protein
MKIETIRGHLTATNRAHIKKMAEMSGFIKSICNDINAPHPYRSVKVNRIRYIFTDAGENLYNLQIIQVYTNTIGDIARPHSSFAIVKITN